MSIGFIGLGSNLGAAQQGITTPQQQLQRAKIALQQLPKSELLAVSALYRSPAMVLPGSDAQPDYCNAVVQLQTALSPHALLIALRSIEQTQGRVRSERWAARTLDLDILLYDQLHMQDELLTLPHPGLAQRDFVLYPLQDIVHDMEIPGLGWLSELIAALPSGQTLERIGAFDD